MFWGLKLENGKKYSQLVEKSFHISHAALSSYRAQFQNFHVEIHTVVEKTGYIIGYLGKIGEQFLVQQPLDLNLSEGEEIVFYIEAHVGDGTPVSIETSVYLTGYFREEPEVPFNLDDLLSDKLAEEEDEDVSEEDSEMEGGEEALWNALMMNASLSEDGSDEEYTLPAILPLKDKQGPLKGQPVIEEIVEERESVAEDGAKKRANRKRKHVDTDQRKGEVEPESKEMTAVAPEAKKRKKKKQKENGDETSTKKTCDDPPLESAKSKKQKKVKTTTASSSFKTSGGTEVQDLKSGTGKIAKNGRKVFVKYAGRLAHNNKIFDSNITSSRPFMFRLGQREVIPGWDEGIEGMKVGGKRKLHIPAAQGYGVRGAPPKIPPNSKLIFDVELLDVK